MTVEQTADVPPVIRRAGEEDRERISLLIGEAFMDDPVSGWVFPDEAHRREVHPRFFGVFLQAALRDGWVDVAADYSAAAMWLPVTGGHDGSADEGEDDMSRQLAEIAGNERGGLIGQLTAGFHPTEPHYYLPIIGVRPGHQGRGLGAALIGRVLERCDREGMPAYLEASSTRSRVLYERLGFVFTGRTVDLPGGPQMWPMRREPRG
jgi:GNAT superfamily N-acetyltransferase